MIRRDARLWFDDDNARFRPCNGNGGWPNGGTMAPQLLHLMCVFTCDEFARQGN
ncbi:adhesion G protein-coupled receptor A3 [Sesbania bispinosa]|nr:adhesion G protein-coupled receptor A3 [Sesbania bispinosa]